MIFPSSKIAVSSWTWHDPFYKGQLNLVDIPALAREAGINQVELNDFMLPPGRWSRTRKFFRKVFGYEKGSPKLQRYVPSTIRELTTELRKNQVDCISWTLDSDLTVSENHWRRELAYIITGMQTAVELNAQMVRLTIGGSEHMKPEIDYMVIRRLKLIAAFCDQLFPTIQPVVENHWGLTTDINRFVNIMAAVPEIGICFDPGNLSEKARTHAADLVAAKTEALHLKVIDLHPQKLDHDIDYRPIVSQLVEHGFCGKFVIEYEGDGDPAETLEAILKQLKEWPQTPANLERNSQIAPIQPEAESSFESVSSD